MNATPEREWYALARRDDGLVFCSCFEPIDWSRDQHAALMLSELEAMDVARRVPGAWAHRATLAAVPREPDSTVLRQALQWIADGDGPVGMRVIARRALAAAPPPPRAQVDEADVRADERERWARMLDGLHALSKPNEPPSCYAMTYLIAKKMRANAMPSDVDEILAHTSAPTPPRAPVDEGPEATALRRLLDEELNVQRLSYGAWRVWDDSNAQSEGEGRTLVEALSEYDAARDDGHEASTAEIASDNALRERVTFRETRQMWLYGATAEQRREIYRSGARRIGLDEATVERLFPAPPTERAPTEQAPTDLRNPNEPRARSRADCEIIEGFMPEWRDATPIVAVRVTIDGREHFLRHSKGPLQGHFLDTYPDDYQRRDLAELAIAMHLNPPRIGPPDDMSGETDLRRNAKRLENNEAEIRESLASIGVDHEDFESTADAIRSLAPLMSCNRPPDGTAPERAGDELAKRACASIERESRSYDPFDNDWSQGRWEAYQASYAMVRAHASRDADIPPFPTSIFRGVDNKDGRGLTMEEAKADYERRHGPIPEPASELDRLAEIARAHVMTDEERAAQRESFVRGNLAFGSDADEARERQGSRAALPTVPGEPPLLGGWHWQQDDFGNWDAFADAEGDNRGVLCEGGRVLVEEWVPSEVVAAVLARNGTTPPNPPLTLVDNDGLPPGPWDEWLHKPTYTGRPCGCEFEARVVCSKHCGGHGIPGPWPLPPTTPHATNFDETQSRER